MVRVMRFMLNENKIKKIESKIHGKVLLSYGDLRSIFFKRQSHKSQREMVGIVKINSWEGYKRRQCEG